jgi:hypothetical protein
MPMQIAPAINKRQLLRVFPQIFGCYFTIAMLKNILFCYKGNKNGFGFLNKRGKK